MPALVLSAAAVQERHDRVHNTAGHQSFRTVFQCRFGSVRCKQPSVVVVDFERPILTDGIDYEQVDIVADLTALPFKTGSIDCFASRSVLEHVPELNRVIEEIKRCTRIGGLNVHHTPFLFPYHASPHDYQRFTHTGITNLFKGWELIEQVNVGGPVSLFLILMTEFGSILLSGGNQKLEPYIYLSLCVLLFPLKFVDILFIRRKSMLVLAPTMVTVLRRP